MPWHKSLSEAGEACRDLRSLGAIHLDRDKAKGTCPDVANYEKKTEFATHCIHRFPDLTEVCCGCEKVFSESPTKIREKEIRYKQLEEDGII